MVPCWCVICGELFWPFPGLFGPMIFSCLCVALTFWKAAVWLKQSISKALYLNWKLHYRFYLWGNQRPCKVFHNFTCGKKTKRTGHSREGCLGLIGDCEGLRVPGVYPRTPASSSCDKKGGRQERKWSFKNIRMALNPWHDKASTWGREQEHSSESDNSYVEFKTPPSRSKRRETEKDIWRVRMQKPLSAIWNFVLEWSFFIKLVYLSSVIWLKWQLIGNLYCHLSEITELKSELFIYIYTKNELVTEGGKDGGLRRIQVTVIKKTNSFLPLNRVY